MKQYLDLMRHVLTNGHRKDDRTGTGTLSTFGYQLRFNLQEGFPLVTTKRCHLRSIIHELLWFLQGDTNIKYLNDNNVTIWNEWARTTQTVKEVEFSVEQRLAYFREMNTATQGISEFYQNWEGGLREKSDAEIMGILDVHHVPRQGPVTITTEGELGPVYGKQWRDWVGPDGKHHDQITNIINQLRNDPDNRRIIVSAWNVGELEQMALAPCHSFFQFYTRELSLEERLAWTEVNDNDLWSDYTHAVYVDIATRNDWLTRANVPTRVLSCQLYQRSCDVFLGQPFNIASYALLIHMVAQQVNMAVGDFVWTGGDVHLYSNHLEQANLQLMREPRPLPRLVLKRKPESIFDYRFDDFVIEGYDPHPAIKAPVAV